MTDMVIVARDGTEHVLSAQNGATVMEAIREAGYDELLALCGGCLSCATCHVYVEPPAQVTLKPISEDENDLLDSSDHREASSRLSCQIIVDASLEGARIAIAPAD